MDVNCNCFDVATAAKVPVKRYNLLVNAVYPVTEPNRTKPLGTSTEKNIKRLAEYLERNEHRIPKASRRLARHIHDDLVHRKLGYVRVGVAAYMQLITFDEGRFARLYGKELIVKYPQKKRHIWSLGRLPPAARLPPHLSHLGSVVGALMAAKDCLPQLWGLQLLITLLKQQESAEFMDAFEALVPLLCEKAASGSARSSSQQEEGQQSVGGVPAAGLQALLEHLRLCFRISYVSRHLDLITYAVLTIIEAEGDASGLYGRRAGNADSGGRAPLLSQTSIGASVGASTPGVASLLVYQELGRMTRDAAEGKKVLEFLLRFLDDRPARWAGGAALALGLGIMRDACTHEHQRYLLAATLLSHVGSAQDLGPSQRSAVLAQAMQDITALDPGSTAPALLFSLQQLPKAILAAENAHQTAPQEAELLQKNVLDAITALARMQGSRLQLTSVLGAALNRIEGPSALGTAALRCCAAASDAYSHLSSHTGGTGTASTVLWRGVLGVVLRWPPEHRLLAHHILQSAILGARSGLLPPQRIRLFSGLWHELSLDNAQPANYAAMDATFAASLEAISDAQGLMQACQLALGIQHRELINSPVSRWSALALSSTMWMRLSRKLSCPQLDALIVIGVGEGLPSLQIEMDGLKSPRQGGFVNDDEERAASMLATVRPPMDIAQALKLIAKAPKLKNIADEMVMVSNHDPFRPLPPSSLALHIPLNLTGDAHELSKPAKRLVAAFKDGSDAVIKGSQGEEGEAGLGTALPINGAVVSDEGSVHVGERRSPPPRSFEEVFREVQLVLRS